MGFMPGTRFLLKAKQTVSAYAVAVPPQQAHYRQGMIHRTAAAGYGIYYAAANGPVCC